MIDTNEIENDDPRPDAQIYVEGQVREFIVDRRHLDYEQNEANKERLLDFLEAHDLPITSSGLHLAYETLKQDGILELAQPQEPIPPIPAPAPVVPPPIVVAPASSKQTVMYRNGQRIEGTAWKW